MTVRKTRQEYFSNAGSAHLRATLIVLVDHDTRRINMTSTTMTFRNFAIPFSMHDNAVEDLRIVVDFSVDGVDGIAKYAWLDLS